LLLSAIRDDNPVLFLEQKLLYRTKGEVPEGEYSVPLGKAKIHKQGTDATIVTYGRMLPMCLEVAEKLQETEGISVEVVDPRTLVPLDKETIIASARKTGRVLIVHEACQTGGFGGELAAVIADSDAFFYLDAPIKRYGGLDVPIPYCPELEKNVVPTIDKVQKKVIELVCG
jgi:acetoin:2,6-dichlorophenolindophenol oxidoreductase subunit beta